MKFTELTTKVVLRSHLSLRGLGVLLSVLTFLFAFIGAKIYD